MKSLTIAIAAAAVSLTAAQAMAQLSANDRMFASKAASADMVQISLGELATDNAVSAAVRQFAERIVTEDTLLNDQLLGVAQQQHLTLPTNVTSADLASEHRLASMKGEKFDDSFMQKQVQTQQETIAEFSREAGAGQNPALQKFAVRNLPVLQQQLASAETVRTAQR